MYVDLKGTGLVLENVIALTEVTVMWGLGLGLGARARARARARG